MLFPTYALIVGKLLVVDSPNSAVVDALISYHEL
jgi:hypothetical protein